MTLKAFELDLYNVVVANGRYVAGGIPVAPEADIADGLLDIVLIAERGPAELAIFAAQILVGKHLSSDGIIFRRAKKIAISSRPGMWFNVDGELIGNEPAIFELLPQRIAVRSRSSVNSKIITLDELASRIGTAAICRQASRRDEWLLRYFARRPCALLGGGAKTRRCAGGGTER